MGARTTKTASNGVRTACPDCNKPVRGQKGLTAHQKQCAASPIHANSQTITAQ